MLEWWTKILVLKDMAWVFITMQISETYFTLLSNEKTVSLFWEFIWPGTGTSLHFFFFFATNWRPHGHFCICQIASTGHQLDVKHYAGQACLIHTLVHTYTHTHVHTHTTHTHTTHNRVHIDIHIHTLYTYTCKHASSPHCLKPSSPCQSGFTSCGFSPVPCSDFPWLPQL